MFKYGVILGLSSVKPLCEYCVRVSQYCQCSLYTAVLLNICMLVSDIDCIVEIEETNHIVALYPSQI